MSVSTSGSLSELPPGFHRFRYSSGEEELAFEVFLWRGQQSGSTLLLSSGMHGDEYEGPLFLNSLAQEWRPADLKGTVIAIPILNEAAFFAATRNNPTDRKDLDCAFSGDAGGSATEKLASVFVDQFLARADFYVDLRSAGTAYEAMPWAEQCVPAEESTSEKSTSKESTSKESTFELQQKMARCFSEVWHWHTGCRSGRALGMAHKRNIPAVSLNLCGAGTATQAGVQRLKVGFRNLIRVCGLAEGAIGLNVPFALLETEQEQELQSQHLSPCDGLLMKLPRLGARVQKGDELATVSPLDGSSPQKIMAERSGRFVLRRRHRFVKTGASIGAIVTI